MAMDSVTVEKAGCASEENVPSMVCLYRLILLLVLLELRRVQWMRDIFRTKVRVGKADKSNGTGISCEG